MNLLPNPLFLKWLLDGIAKARKTIVIVNYLAVFGKQDKRGPVGQIVCALIDAVKRKVRVQIILEGNKLSVNYRFWRVLKDAGADVWLDTSVTFIHTKAFLIDDRRLCIGSHNVTNAALTRHEEISLMTADPSAVRSFKKELERYTAQRYEIGDASKEGVPLPATVIEALVKIKRSAAFHAYFMYLLLCRLDKGVPKSLPLDAKDWAGILKLSDYGWGAYARIKLLLKFMDKRLGVVRFDEKRKVVKRIDVPKAKDSILLPDAFWEFEWHRRLSAGAVHYYILGEVERQMSPYAPWWRLKRDQVAKKYGFQKQLVNRAQRELMRHDLLEVLFETWASKRKPHIRYMNYFRQNPFYNYDEREAKIDEISKRYPKPVYTIARRIVAGLNADMSEEKVGSLCRYTAEKGLRCARGVLKTISGLSKNSTRRTFDYVVELFGVQEGITRSSVDYT